MTRVIEPLDFLEAKAFLPETRIYAIADKLNEIIGVLNALQEHRHLVSSDTGTTSTPTRPPMVNIFMPILLVAIIVFWVWTDKGDAGPYE